MTKIKDYQYEPKELVNLGLHQLDLFIYVNKSENINIKIASHFNLHLAFELVLKGYLIYLDSSFGSLNKLKKLSHNLFLIGKEISKLNNEKGKKINNLFNAYKFFQKDSDQLRYFRKGDEIFLNNSYDTLIDFIREIYKDVNQQSSS